ncbi:MAG: DUF4390 domain-containing protein [Candidatus Rokubacteria bacterium]|nr:DUF4390 domain-containing protein [Candidatus Rokubacteria bacterium]
MLGPRWRIRVAAVLGLLLLLSTDGWAGPLRISNLVVTNADRTLVVNVVLLGSLPDGVVEGLGTGIPATVRFQVELWQYNAWWVDRRIAAKILERQVVYDVLTKEYRVSAVQGEEREPYVTRDIWEAGRVLSEVRGLRLVPITSLQSRDLYYVRVRADIRSGAPDSSLAKIMPFWSSRVETAWERSPLLTLSRTW